MVLLVLLAVGLLSLSTVALRSSVADRAQAEARANARLAMLLALGQLQKHAGDDRRISRSADQIPADTDGGASAAAPGRRFWTAIYKSWDGKVQLRPQPEWLAWLVSDPDPSGASEQAPTLAEATGQRVELVGSATAGGQAEDVVEVGKVGVRSNGRTTGRLAWWTGDQGMKAMLATPPVEAAENLAEVRGRLQAAPRHGVEVASTEGGKPFRGFDRTDPRLPALTDWPQASLFAADRETPKELFHDLAARTSGLLVNVREGGFRRDLSMEFEKPLRDRTTAALYTVSGEKGISFEELHAYYNLHRKLEPVSGRFTTGGNIPLGTMGLKLKDTPGANQSDEAFHFKMPIVVSLQVAISLQARPQGSDRDQIYRLYVVIDPILTFWNPLDVPVVIPSGAWMTFNFFQFPYTIDVSSGVDRWECPLVASLSGSTVNAERDNNFAGLRVGELEQLVFKPGEVIKVSQSGDLRVEGNTSNHALQGKSGFNFGGGVARPLRDKAGRTLDLKANASITYTMKPNGFTTGKTSQSGATLSGSNQHTRHFGLQYHEFFIGTDRPNQGGLGYGGISIDFDFGNTRAKPGVIWQAGTPGTKPPRDRIYADRRELANVFPTFGARDTRPLSVAQLAAAKAPILMYSYSAKTEKTSPTGTRTLLRFNPRAHRLDFYALDEYERDLQPFDFQVEALNSWVNRRLETSTNGNAYFGGSYDAADGTSFVTTHSVPQEPIHSLGALQHSMANGFEMQAPQQGYTALNARQPMLPQVSHPIGNSSAPAVLSSYETSRTISGGRPVADHSYLANLALWDEWFFSSVSPQQATTYSSRRSQRQVATQFLEGSEPLPITHYRPDLGNLQATEALAKLFSGTGVKAGAEELMASLIRVEGMFNINSTSVEAWRVLLSSLLAESIATRDEGGKLSLTAASPQVPVTGLMAPLDVTADAKAAVPVRDPKQWVGRRVLNDEEITLLAEAIVREVRKRGPFLSLADFVNRRVGSNPELARAGAIQSALDADEVPINKAYNDGERAVPKDVAQRLPFPAAEEGPRSAGIAGIVKQADLLTPLAPILSARSDTFLIRAYGEALDGEGKVSARAWCEAEVQRGSEFITGEEPRDTHPDDLKNAIDQTFGRRFEIVSFRWLGPREL
jgi:hypothetical protein